MRITTKDIRNVVLLGHSGSGKTTFAETMLFESGAISRRGSINNKNTVSDYTKIEQERENSIFSTLMHVKWRNNKINIIDTPGYDDFVGEVISSLKVADTALILLNATAGVEVGTELLWEYVDQYKTPTIFIINQIDHEKANYEKTLEQTKNRFGPKVIPIQFPYDHDSGSLAIVDALRMTMYVFPNEGGKPIKENIPTDAMSRAKELHNVLVEAAAENEEGLMEKYFENGTLDESDLAKGLTIALAKHEIFPVFCASAIENKGSGRIMGFINDISPSPADSPPIRLQDGNEIAYDPEDDTRIFIYKTLTEPQVGRVSYFKVFSGTIRSGDNLENLTNHETERISQIYEAEGKIRNAVDNLVAGDIGVTVKLKDSHTNDTLGSGNAKVSIEPIHFPNSRIRTAVVPPSKSDMEKLMKVLHIFEEEDPTLHLEQSAELKQTLLHAQGQLHLDIIQYRIKKLNGISMEFERPKIPYRETITKEASTHYRHKKQSGGSGQFAEVHMRLDPYYEGVPEPEGLNIRKKEIENLPWGGKLAFYWCIVGGTIDSKYMNAVKKGIMHKMEEGPLTGSRCQDIRVCIYDGKMHAVDSNDMAFMLAASNAFKIAFKDAGPQLLEPIYDVEVLCSSEVLGDIMGDLQTRRAVISGMDADDHYQKVKAKVPFAEMYKYSSTLRSISQGKAKFNRSFAMFQAVPYVNQEQLMSEHSRLEEA